MARIRPPVFLKRTRPSRRRAYVNINKYAKKNFKQKGILESPASFMTFFNGALQEAYQDVLRPFKKKTVVKEIKEIKNLNQKKLAKQKVRLNYERVYKFRKKLDEIYKKIKEIMADLRKYLIEQRKDLNPDQIKAIEEEIEEWEFLANNVLNTFINFLNKNIDEHVKPVLDKIK